MYKTLIFAAIAGTVVAGRGNHDADVECPIVFDGRVPADATPADFTSVNGGGWNPFNPDYVKGNALEWDDIIELPDVKKPSRFDAPDDTVPLEVTLSDDSIFMTQEGFRRAGLLFQNDSNTGSPGSSGLKTLHFSIMLDSAKPLNLSHEYLVRRPRRMGPADDADCLARDGRLLCEPVQL